MDPYIKALTKYLRRAEGEVVHVRPGSQGMRIRGFEERKGKIRVEFVDSGYGLPLYIWMFDRAISRLSGSKGFVPVGASVNPPFMQGSIEEAIWDRKGSPYKAAPHVCDVLVTAGLAEYGVTVNSSSGRRVQSVRLKSLSFLQKL